MFNRKFHILAILVAFFAALSSAAHAEGGDLASLVTSVDLTAISVAMATVYGGMITVGIFLKGGSMIAKRLGWK